MASFPSGEGKTECANRRTRTRAIGAVYELADRPRSLVRRDGGGAFQATRCRPTLKRRDRACGQDGGRGDVLSLCTVAGPALVTRLPVALATPPVPIRIEAVGISAGVVDADTASHIAAIEVRPGWRNAGL